MISKHPVLTAGLLVGSATLFASTQCQFPGGPGAVHGSARGFERVASFPVFLNTSEDEQTVSEIVAAADDGKLLVYTDGVTGNIGFVDISDPRDPQPAGVVSVGGEPTSVAVRGRHALAAVDTSVDFVNTSGNLEVIDVFTREIVATIPLGGQPDAVAISPDGRYAVVAIENERDEDLGNGEPPQLPAGFVVIVDLVGEPDEWTTRTVDLVDVPDLFPEDPEPEFVDISIGNVAAVTLQENNHVVLIRLASGKIVRDFSAGAADLADVDVDENDLIEQTAALSGVPREPDAVAWTSNTTFVTADEGDLFGGSRGFTIWSASSLPLYQAGSTLEHLVARLGHYPEDRSENKGGEPEGVEYGRYGQDRLLFVGSERSNVVFVYELFPGVGQAGAAPRLVQVLPTGVGPEGLLAIPERDLFVVACEEDERGDKIRSTIMIYERTGEPNYPTVESADRGTTGLPIPWGALSALAVDPADDDTVHTLHDSFYRHTRIFTLDTSSSPALNHTEIELRDEDGLLLAALTALESQLPASALGNFDPAAMVEASGQVNLDGEGLAIDAAGGFWIASEGAGNLADGVSDPDDRPFEAPNLLVRAHLEADAAVIDEVVLPPLELTLDQLRFGFEGVAAKGDHLYVAFQRAWQEAGDPSDRARIGRYDRTTGEWAFAYYPLETPSSPAGGWVGLSELTWLGGDRFAVIERDDQGGPDARVKLITSFSVAGVSFQEAAAAPGFELLAKTVESDLLADGVYLQTGGPVPEKLEGLAVRSDGTALIVNDNDGVDTSNGETQLLRLDALFD